MVKQLFSIFLFLVSAIIFGQDAKLSNKTHPFQVLFVDSATIIGQDEPINQFDFIGKYDLINNYGELVLVHYSGEVLETSASVLKLRELSKSYSNKFWNSIQRPEIFSAENSISIRLDSILFKNRVTDEGITIICGEPPIQILHPEIIGAYASIPAFKDSIDIIWKSEEHIDEFLVRLVNIFDEEIYLNKTKGNHISVPIDKLKASELTLFEISSIDNEVISGVFALCFLEVSKNQSYDKLLKALQLQWDKPSVANENFKESIYLSENDPRFIKLYKSFLEMYPKFK